MSDDNPYAPPVADLINFDEDVRGVRLADRSSRFVAALVGVKQGRE
jgi:hypothetical protein